VIHQGRWRQREVRFLGGYMKMSSDVSVPVQKDRRWLFLARRGVRLLGLIALSPVALVMGLWVYSRP
jgi:hypothetical protein